MKTTSLELSKKLKDAGAKQSAQHWWIRDGEDIRLYEAKGKIDTSTYSWAICAAFDCHELLEGLPCQLQDSDGMFSYVLSLAHEPEGVFTAFYAGAGDQPLSEFYTTEITPAEALGKLKLWCLENGHCNECDHEWIDATNEHVEGTELCLKCHAVRPMSNGHSEKEVA